MKQLFRNLLIIAAFVAILAGAFLYLRPYVARRVYLWRNSPFAVVSKKLISDPSPSVRGQAALTLVNIDRARCVRPLVDTLKTDAEIREDVQDALIEVGKPALPPLLSVLHDEVVASEPDIELLGRILVIFSRIENKEGKDTWLELIRDRSMPREIREAAVELLGNVDVAEIQQIADYLDTTQMRLEAIQAISESGDVKFAPFLIERFLDDPDHRVRRSTLEAMGNLLKEEEEEEEQPLVSP